MRNSTAKIFLGSSLLTLAICGVLAVISTSWNDHVESHRGLQDTNTRVNIFQKLGESLGTSIVGFILICIMPIMIWKNEGRHARELQRIEFAKNEAVAVDCNEPGEENAGRLVYFAGRVTVGDDSLQFDPATTQLSLARGVPNAFVIKRTCYIYQKFEDSERNVQQNRLGGGETRTTTYSMREGWTAMGPQPAQLPHIPDQTNSSGIWSQLVEAAGTSGAGGGSSIPLDQIPPEMVAKMGLYDLNRSPHGLLISPVARVGEFNLTFDLVAKNQTVFLSQDPILANPDQPKASFLPSAAGQSMEAPARESYLKPVPNTFLPDSIPGCPGLKKGSDNILRTYPEGNPPQNGDCQVVFEFALDGFEASFVVAQAKKAQEESADVEKGGPKYQIEQAQVVEDKCFGQCHNDMGTLWMVRRGIHDLSEMIDMAKVEESNATKLLRVICWALLCAGWAMIFSPFTTALSVLPILGSIGNAAVFIVALITSLLCCFTVMVLAYVRYRSLLASALLLLAGGIWGIVAWRLNIAVEEGDDTLAPSPSPTML